LGPYAALCDVFALAALSSHGLLLLLDAGCLPLGSLGRLDAALTAACARVRRHAVPLTDAFLIHDDALGSTLGGSRDGSVLPALERFAAAEPLNLGARPGSGGTATAARELTMMRQAAEAGLHAQRHGGHVADVPKL